MPMRSFSTKGCDLVKPSWIFLCINHLYIYKTWGNLTFFITISHLSQVRLIWVDVRCRKVCKFKIISKYWRAVFIMCDFVFCAFADPLWRCNAQTNVCSCHYLWRFNVSDSAHLRLNCAFCGPWQANLKIKTHSSLIRFDSFATEIFGISNQCRLMHRCILNVQV